MIKKFINILALIIISVPSISMQLSSVTDYKIRDNCPTNARINLTGGVLDPTSGFIAKSGYIFSPDSIWTENEEIIGCSCSNRPNCSSLYCPTGSYLYQRIYYGYCNESIDITGDYDESINETETSIYSLDLPFRSVQLNDENVYTENPFYAMCSWNWELLLTTNFSDNNIFVKSDGAIYLPNRNISAMYNFDSYCLCNDDNFRNNLPMCLFRSIIFTKIENYDDIISTNGDSTRQTGTTMASHIAMIISIPFLIITIIVYTILPEMKNIHGLTLRAYVGCLLVAYTTLVFIQITGPISDLMCLSFAFTIQLSFLASFFWLNTICFDIWWSFGGFRSIRGSVDQRDNKRFAMYSIYAFCCASLLTGTSMIVDLVPGIPDYLIRPEFGMETDCWFKTDEAKALYFYGPMGVTIILNIFCFVSTAVKIIRHKKSTARHLKGVNSKRHDEKRQWFNLYLKLFIVMGINWSMEIISWLYTESIYFRDLTDLGNALEGFTIFIIFICKKNIIRSILKRFGCRVPSFLSQDSTTRTGIRFSNTSQTTGNSSFSRSST